MKPGLDTDRPLFLQIKETIEEDILTGVLKADDQIPSNSQLVSFYGINPVTVHKGVSLLLEEGTVYKKRGLGMFVSVEAPALLRKNYQERFWQDYIQPLVHRAALLGLSVDELRKMIGDEQR
jgi:DNA-binding transcriptional regulator YhcF (GntR family)